MEFGLLVGLLSGIGTLLSSKSIMNLCDCIVEAIVFSSYATSLVSNVQELVVIPIVGCVSLDEEK